MRDLNAARWSDTSDTTGWDSIEGWIAEIVMWEATNAESFERLARGAGYRHDIPYIVRGQNYIRIFNNAIENVLCN